MTGREVTKREKEHLARIKALEDKRNHAGLFDGTVLAHLSGNLKRASTSGINGVVKSGTYWATYFDFQGKRVHMGRWQDIESAKMLRAWAEKHIHKRLYTWWKEVYLKLTEEEKGAFNESYSEGYLLKHVLTPCEEQFYLEGTTVVLRLTEYGLEYEGRNFQNKKK
jgi:hypothetical protein